MWSTWYATSRAPVRRSHDRQPDHEGGIAVAQDDQAGLTTQDHE
jgi:hypothetical protein